MEDLTVKKLPVVVTDGSNSSYHLGAAEEHDPEKQETRVKIAEFFLQSPYAGREGPVFGMLSLPGKFWHFEHLFFEMCSSAMKKRLFFNGLEWSWPVIEQGLGWMPRRTPRRGPVMANYGMTTGRIQGYATTFARWMHVHSDTYVQFTDDDLKHPSRQIWYDHAFRGNTVIWMDFTSSACPVVMDTLINLGNSCRIVTQPVHIAVTLMVGRDSIDLEKKGDPLATRVHFIDTCLNLNKYKSFELVDAWTYKSVSGVTMATVIGKLITREGVNRGNDS